MKQCYYCFNHYDDAYTTCPYCGVEEPVQPAALNHLVPGTVLCDRYVIGTAVGSGGFGIVYRAWDLKLESVVAVKEFFASRLVTRAPGTKELIVAQKGRAEFDYRKERFLAEARTMAKFNTHRSIPNVFEFFEENNTAYIVMELLQGITLGQYIASNGGKMDVDFATMVINEVGNALESLHKEGVIHCDVAPDNIFLCSGKDIKVKLMDLGVAKLKDSSAGVIDIIIKPGFSPAEQYDNGKNIGPWTDVYSLGATFYMMLTGIKPDESTNRKIDDSLIPPMQLESMVNENLSNAIMKAMAIDIHMRFKKAEEFLAAINGERKVISLAKEKRRKKATRFIGIGAALAVLLTSAGLVARQYDKEAAEGYLNPADISVWYAVADGSSEHEAMQFIADDFKTVFPDVNIELRAIEEDTYADEIRKAAESNDLPDLFESTNIDDDVLQNAKDVDELLKSEQANACLFLNQYRNYYSDSKKLPLAIEVPVAYVITSGNTSTKYDSAYFSNLSDFEVDAKTIAADARCGDMIIKNFGNSNYADIKTFMDNTNNTSPVLLSSTTILNEFRNTLVGYEKTCVFYDTNAISCNFTYEWSIGATDNNELAAAKRMLSWMLGNAYQSALMITKCNDGQIPMNEICFNSKIGSKYLSPIRDIYDQFVFEATTEEQTITTATTTTTAKETTTTKKEAAAKKTTTTKKGATTTKKATTTTSAKSDITWDLSKGVLTISGKGAMENYKFKSAPWYADRSSIKKVVIKDGVTSIGNTAFRNGTALTNITIPDSVTAIGDEAFYNCESLKTISVPKSVTKIGKKSFVYCNALTTIQYAGTKAQWKAIEKGDKWNDGSGSITIKCSDGDLTESDS